MLIISDSVGIIIVASSAMKITCFPLYSKCEKENAAMLARQICPTMTLVAIIRLLSR